MIIENPYERYPMEVDGARRREVEAYAQRARDPQLCDRTWRSDRPTRTDDTHRQHRCGHAAGHADEGCRCRYCGQPAPGVTR